MQEEDAQQSSFSAEQVSDCAAKGPASMVANSKGAGDRPEGCMILCKRHLSLAGPDLRDLVWSSEFNGALLID
jgi:hypothetical protein